MTDLLSRLGTFPLCAKINSEGFSCGRRWVLYCSSSYSSELIIPLCSRLYIIYCIHSIPFGFSHNPYEKAFKHFSYSVPMSVLISLIGLWTRIKSSRLTFATTAACMLGFGIILTNSVGSH